MRGRGRKIQVGKISITVYVRHSKRCRERDDNSGTVKCDCVRWMQFKDGSRESTHQWTWAKAEEIAKKRAAELEGVSYVLPLKFGPILWNCLAQAQAWSEIATEPTPFY
jgi:hypothetical protein